MNLKKLKFIDLFAGIGGFHQAMTANGAECVFASEWDKNAADTYHKNYNIKPFGDITKINEKDIPHHDILCGGFPCQAFSVSGKQKGFDDSRGTLFFDIARIVKYHKPRLLFLENVRNFEKHDNGNTLKVVIRTLDELGYDVNFKVLNASNFGLPQNRQRIYFVCFRKDIIVEKFKFPTPTNEKVSLNDILETNPEAKIIDRNDIVIKKEFELKKNIFNEFELPNKPIQIGIVNKGGQGERIYDPNGHAITLSAHGGGIGSKTGLYKIDKTIRKLSTRECARIQGFGDDFKIVSSQSQAYKQFGNSVAINVLKAILKNITQTKTIEIQTTQTDIMDNKQLIGSQTAKGGFENEDDIAEKFNNYKNDIEAQKWLEIMGYDYSKVETLQAITIPVRISKDKAISFGATPEKIDETIKYKKADIQVQLEIIVDNLIYRENLSLKKANKGANFNQIDKRPVATYQDMWGFNDSICETLKKFTGEILPSKGEAKNLKDSRRWYLNELPKSKVDELISFFESNKVLVFNDILKGRGVLAAEWFLVTRKDTKTNTLDWVLKNINEVTNIFSQGKIEVSNRGGLNLCKLRAQRKGGTPDPKSLQFKISPLDIFE